MRTDHLRIASSLARRLAQLREAGAPEARNIERLLFPIARAIPGATITGQTVDPQKITDAASSELALIEEPDLAERREAAARLNSSSESFRLWGRPMRIDVAAQERAIK
jgi:hypothetical protein